MNSDRLMRILAGTEDAGSGPPSIIDPVAQVDELRRVLMLVNQPKADFVRGDFVRLIHGTGNFVQGVEDQIRMVFWRKLGTDPQDQERGRHCAHSGIANGLDRVDCILAIYTRKGLSFELGNTDLLVPDGRVQPVS